MSTKSKYIAGVATFYDSVTHERVLVAAPVQMKDDFLGKVLDTTNTWATRITGAAPPTAALVANGASGILACTLTATNEAQLAGVDVNNVRNFVLNQGLMFEARVKLSVLPTGAVIACIGLCGDHNAAVDTVAESIWFRLDGSGVVTVETDDTVHETSKVATGITLLNTDFAILRIDCSDITSVKFFINGNQVAAGTVFNMSQVAGLALQPVARIGKEGAATTVGTLQVDYLSAWQARA